MSLIVKEEAYKNFGKCVYIANEVQEMRVTVDIGPRIISYNLIGKENMMFNDVERASKKDSAEYKKVFGENKNWYIYGGHRFWVSPEEFPLTYYPDDEKVDYTQNGNVFTFTPPVQAVTGWQTSLEITFDENEAKASVRHILENKSGKEKTGSIWVLSVTAAGGSVYQKMANEDTGLLANRTLMLWPYNKMSDKRFYMDDEYIAVHHASDAELPFKIGTNNTAGAVICVNNGTVFKKEYTHIAGATYPDNGCSTEVYTDRRILEMETLSPLFVLKDGDVCEHTEKWSLTAEKSKNLEDIVKHL